MTLLMSFEVFVWNDGICWFSSWCFVFILIVRHDVMMERSRKVFTLYRLQKYKKQMRRRTFHCTKFGDYMKKSKFEPENYVFYNGETCMNKIRYT